MRLKKLLLGVVAGIAGVAGMEAAPAGISNIEPPYWWVGMKNDTLQLMLTGPEIAGANFSVDYPGVKLVEQVKLDSPNYKLLYLTIAPDTKPGTVKFRYSSGGRKSAFDYQLRERTMAAEDYEGFDAGDVLYLLMPDRFAQGMKEGEADLGSLDYPVTADRNRLNARHGGDMRGIRQHLDYIDSLGVTAIWLCPVLENDMPGGSYHGYATTDYYRIDPRFGTNEEYATLVEEAHGRGLKVVMDMIFNHSGSNHPWMKDMPSADWYNHPEGDVMTNFRLTTVHDPYVSDYDLDHTVNGWFVPSMPDLNQRNPHVMRYLTQNSIWWIESAKINGIRMDTYPYADMKAMASWAADVLREYPNFNIVGECWYGNESGGAFWQRGSKLNPVDTHLPSVMDFYFVQGGRRAVNDDTDPWHGLNDYYDHLSQDFMYPDPQNILTFLDNHDSDRFLLELPDRLDNWRQAVTLLLTSRGIPQIYYGTELLMHGTKEGSDGKIRLDMPGGFPGDTTDAFTAEGRSELQNEAWDFMSKLLQWRRGEVRDIMARGSLKHFMPQNGLYVYERRLGDRSVVVLLHGRDTEETLTMERTVEVLPYGSEWLDVISGEPVTISEEMTFPARGVMVLEAR